MPATISRFRKGLERGRNGQIPNRPDAGSELNRRLSFGEPLQNGQSVIVTL